MAPIPPPWERARNPVLRGHLQADHPFDHPGCRLVPLLEHLRDLVETAAVGDEGRDIYRAAAEYLHHTAKASGRRVAAAH